MDERVEEMKFSDIKYQRPDTDAFLSDMDLLIKEFDPADSAEEQLSLISRSDEMLSDLYTMSTIAEIRNTVDTRDSFYEGEKAFFDDFMPVMQTKMQELVEKIVKSPFRSELETELGDVYFINAEMSLKAFSPEIVPLMQEEGALTTEYQKLYASARIPFEGKELTVAQLGAYKQSSDRTQRKAAYEAEGRFFDENRAKFDEIFDKLVKNRSLQAKKLGFDSFVELGYLRRQRNCYTPHDVAVFREQIISDVVPMVNKIKEDQKKRIGVDDFKFYDNSFMFSDGNAKPHGSPDELLLAAKRMYEEMSPQTAEFIDVMFDMELFDVVAKDGKAPGGYCTSLPKYKLPFVFSNFNGTSADVDVLTHEMGHAFADYVGEREIKWLSNVTPSMEGAETHSMSMEFLTSPWHRLFFAEDTAKYQLSHAEDALIFLPYGTMVDHFQEIVYSNPDMTPDERNAEWTRLEKIYRPYIDFDSLPFYSRGAGWQRQLHIYLYPFYYIDYCMAQTVALEFFALHLNDPEDAWRRYLDFVKLGGTKTFVGLVKSVGLKTPLEKGSIGPIVEELGKWIEKNNI